MINCLVHNNHNQNAITNVKIVFLIIAINVIRAIEDIMDYFSYTRNLYHQSQVELEVVAKGIRAIIIITKADLMVVLIIDSYNLYILDKLIIVVIIKQDHNLDIKVVVIVREDFNQMAIMTTQELLIVIKIILQNMVVNSYLHHTVEIWQVDIQLQVLALDIKESYIHQELINYMLSSLD